MSARPGTRAVAAARAHLLLQGLAVPAWWAALARWEGFRAPFELGARSVLDGFLVPDVVLAAASLGAAVLAGARPRAGAALAALTCGAVLYSTALTCAYAAAAGTGGVGAVAMALAAAGSAAALLVLQRSAR
ncbi:hypothetical protein [Kineococcus sp. SYSU DK005]|uniref:hypothetical protein n=1 Tax=Kineococcus sp. SYSU DK005 TaxID=3383126 RepID=UPI003D7D8560